MRRRVFLDAYIANGCNAREAAITAGYSAHTAVVKGCQLLQEPAVAAALDKRREQLAKKCELEVESVLDELSGIVHFDIADLLDADGQFLPIQQWPPRARRAVGSIEFHAKSGRIIKVKPNEKNAALEKAMKHLGLFKKDAEQFGKAAGEVVAAQMTMLEAARRVAFVLDAGRRESRKGS